MTNLERANFIIKNKFAETFQKYTYIPNKVTLGQKVLGGIIVPMKPIISTTDGGRKGDCFILVRPEVTKFKGARTRELLYTTILYKKDFESISDDIFARFVEDFLTESTRMFRQLVGEGAQLIGTTPLTLQPPGYEEFARETESGDIELRLYTDLEPINKGGHMAKKKKKRGGCSK